MLDAQVIDEPGYVDKMTGQTVSVTGDELGMQMERLWNVYLSMDGSGVSQETTLGATWPGLEL